MCSLETPRTVFRQVPPPNPEDMETPFDAVLERLDIISGKLCTWLAMAGGSRVRFVIAAKKREFGSTVGKRNRTLPNLNVCDGRIHKSIAR